MESFGKQLIAARKAAGLTQDQLASKINVTRQAVSHWENGRSLPDMETVARLSQLLGCQFTGLVTVVAPDAGAPVPPAYEPAPMETQPTDIPRRFRVPHWLCYVLSFLSGAVITFLVVTGIYLQHYPAEVLFGPIPTVPVIAHLSTERNTPDFYRQPDFHADGQPFVTLVADRDPVPVQHNDEFPDGIGWFYTVYLTESGDRPFTIDELILVELFNNRIMYEQHYDAELLAQWWGAAEIPAGAQRNFTGGMPYQELDGIGLLLVGRDAQGRPLDFRGYIQFDKALPE